MIRPKLVVFAALLLLLAPAFVLKTDLVNTSLLKGFIELKIPSNFRQKSENYLASTYQVENRPSLLYTKPMGGVQLSIKQTTDSASQLLIGAYKDNFVQSYRSDFPDAEWKVRDVKEINGRKVGVLEVITSTKYKRTYHLIFFTDVKGRLVVCTFKCGKKHLKKWRPIAHEIMNSFRVN